MKNLRQKNERILKSLWIAGKETKWKKISLLKIVS